MRTLLMPTLLRLLLLATVAVLVAASSNCFVAAQLVTGDLEVWDRIFASRAYQVLLDGPTNDLSWTEGPILVGNELIFSDTLGDKVYSLDLNAAIREDNGTKDRSKHLRIIKDRSGDSPPEDDHWRAEPGGNGLALLSNSIEESYSPKVLMCQHGAQRLAIMDLNTGETQPLASEYKGKRLNGPNDVVTRAEEVKGEGFRTYAYFTDPVYAWLEKDRFADMPYLDDKVRREGPGHCGVYRVEVPSSSKKNVELITSDMARPNGIGFDGDDLIVADCCQGSHLDKCTSGISRWEILRQRASSGSNGSPSWAHSVTIEDIVSPDEAVGGCSDGFTIYSFADDTSTYGRRRRRNKHVLLAACFGGFCVVDLELGEVVARMWTAKEEYGGCRISNVAVGKESLILTGSCGVLTLPIRKQGQSNMADIQDEESLHAEL